MMGQIDSSMQQKGVRLFLIGFAETEGAGFAEAESAGFANADGEGFSEAKDCHQR